MTPNQLLDNLLETVKYSLALLEENNMPKHEKSKFFTLLYEGIEEIETKEFNQK